MALQFCAEWAMTTISDPEVCQAEGDAYEKRGQRLFLCLSKLRRTLPAGEEEDADIISIVGQTAMEFLCKVRLALFQYSRLLRL